MPLYREGTSEGLVVEDPWLRLADDAAVPADGMVLVSFARWREARAALLARRGPVGVALGNTDPVEALARARTLFSVVYQPAETRFLASMPAGVIRLGGGRMNFLQAVQAFQQVHPEVPADFIKQTMQQAIK